MEFFIQRLQLLRYHEDEPVDDSPYDEVGSGAVPDSGDRPYDKGSQIHRQTFSDTLPAIFSQELGQVLLPA